jgi:MFS family permease
MRERGYRNYLLVLLLVILTFNLQDGLALGLVLQAIKVDLNLTDTQLGFLSGIAFALFYSVMGIPIARWADRGNRVAIIALTTAAWSVMVASCGLAANFVQLLLIRVGVAVGEAGCMPPAHSLIADYFPRPERPRAVGLYLQGASLSVVMGYFLAGWLNQFYGWRVMFMALGSPGLLLAVLAWTTLREPRRGKSSARTASVRSEPNARAPEQPRAKEVCMTLLAIPTFRQLLFAFSLSYFFGFGILQWQPAFFVRSYGLTTGQVGTWLP